MIHNSQTLAIANQDNPIKGARQGLNLASGASDMNNSNKVTNVGLSTGKTGQLNPNTSQSSPINSKLHNPNTNTNMILSQNMKSNLNSDSNQNQNSNIKSSSIKEGQAQNSNVPCQICGKESLFSCYDCRLVNYCGRQHQKKHWKDHRKECQQIKNRLSQRKIELTTQILEARRNYFENYSNKIYTRCLLDVKLMYGLSREMLSLEGSVKAELDFGASVCLLVRTYNILEDNLTAKFEMGRYLTSSNKFLHDSSQYQNLIASNNINNDRKQELQMKLNLISTLANLCYCIGLSATEYYVLYTKYVIACFGEESSEASNCYFLLGCYFAEEGLLLKAIACFEKAAKIRGTFAGDCMYNIGVLNKLIGNLPHALKTLSVAMKLREEQYGEDSDEVAEVYELMGVIYTDLNDYRTALIEFEKARQIRQSQSINSPEYLNVLEMIQELYSKLCLYITMGQPNMKRPEIYTHLKQEIYQNQHYNICKDSNNINNINSINIAGNINNFNPDTKDTQKRKKEDEEAINKQNNNDNFKKKKESKGEDFSWKESGLFNISEDFIATLSLSELFRLSELQLELDRCHSPFSLVYTIGTSVFLETLKDEQKKELMKDNKQLFSLINLEDIKKIKHNDK